MTSNDFMRIGRSPRRSGSIKNRKYPIGHTLPSFNRGTECLGVRKGANRTFAMPCCIDGSSFEKSLGSQHAFSTRGKVLMAAHSSPSPPPCRDQGCWPPSLQPAEPPLIPTAHWLRSATKLQLRGFRAFRDPNAQLPTAPRLDSSLEIEPLIVVPPAV